MVQTISREAARAKGLKRFYTGQPCAHEHVAERNVASGGCILCNNSRARNKASRKKAAAKWYAQNTDRAKAIAKSWKDRNPERVAATQSAYKKANPDIVNAVTAKRRIVIKGGGSNRYDAEIKGIYKACPVGMEVDHIFPLTHSLLCGLHVPWNLQYLPISENRSKGNRLSAEHQAMLF